MPPRATFDACLFDLDGVLADSMRQHHQAYVQVLEPLGAKVPRREVFLREGMNAREVARELLGMHRQPVSDVEARRLGDAKQAAFRAMGRPPLYRDAEAAVGILRAAGVKLAVVTGTSRENAEFILGPMASHFQLLLADGDYLRAKPHPDPYVTAAQRLSVHPTKCVVVENAPLGVRAAVGAGMTCIALPTTMPIEVLRDAGAHAIALNLREAAGLILQGQGFKRP